MSTKTKTEKLPAGWRVSSRTLRRVFKGRGRILGAAWVCKLVDMVSGRRSWCPVRSYNMAADEIDYKWALDWGRRVGLARKIKKLAAGEPVDIELCIAGCTACGIYLSNADGVRVKWITENGDEWESCS